MARSDGRARRPAAVELHLLLELTDLVPVRLAALNPSDGDAFVAEAAGDGISAGLAEAMAYSLAMRVRKLEAALELVAHREQNPDHLRHRSGRSRPRAVFQLLP